MGGWVGGGGGMDSSGQHLNQIFLWSSLQVHPLNSPVILLCVLHYSVVNCLYIEKRTYREISTRAGTYGDAIWSGSKNVNKRCWSGDHILFSGMQGQF